jgi:hypothetical protein
MTDGDIEAVRKLLYEEDHLDSEWFSVHYNAEVRLAARALLTEVLRLRAEVERSTNLIQRLESVIGEQRSLIGSIEAENAAMREIVRVVAADDWGEYRGADGTAFDIGCPFCLDPSPTHRDGCPVPLAQALLAEDGTP